MSALRDTFNQFVSPTLSGLQSAVEKVEAAVANTKLALETTETAHTAAQETVDAAEAPVEALDELERLETRISTLTGILARQTADLERRRQALDHHLRADEIAKAEKQKKGQVKSVEEGARAALSWTPKLAPALRQLADICDQILQPAYRAFKLYPGFPGHDEICNLIRAEIVAAGLGEIVGIRAPGDDGVKRVNYRMVGNERVVIEESEPVHVPIGDALKVACAQAVENYRIHLGLIAPPPQPVIEPAWVDPDEARQRAERELAKMSRNAGLLRDGLDIPPGGSHPLNPMNER